VRGFLSGGIHPLGKIADGGTATQQRLRRQGLGLSHPRHQAHILRGKKALEKCKAFNVELEETVPHPKDCREFLIFKISS
jgi:hypothetical protein